MSPSTCPAGEGGGSRGCKALDRGMGRGGDEPVARWAEAAPGPLLLWASKGQGPAARGLRTLEVRIPLKLSGLWLSSSRMEANEMNKPMWEKVPSPAFKQVMPGDII